MRKESTGDEVCNGAETSCGEVARAAVQSQRGRGNQQSVQRVLARQRPAWVIVAAGCSRSGSGGRNVAVAQDVRRHDRQDVPHVQIARELGVDRGAVAK